MRGVVSRLNFAWDTSPIRYLDALLLRPGPDTRQVGSPLGSCVRPSATTGRGRPAILLPGYGNELGQRLVECSLVLLAKVDLIAGASIGEGHRASALGVIQVVIDRHGGAGNHDSCF